MEVLKPFAGNNLEGFIHNYYDVCDGKVVTHDSFMTQLNTELDGFLLNSVFDIHQQVNFYPELVSLFRPLFDPSIFINSLFQESHAYQNLSDETVRYILDIDLNEAVKQIEKLAPLEFFIKFERYIDWFDVQYLTNRFKFEWFHHFPNCSDNQALLGLETIKEESYETIFNLILGSDLYEIGSFPDSYFHLYDACNDAICANLLTNKNLRFLGWFVSRCNISKDFIYDHLDELDLEELRKNNKFIWGYMDDELKLLLEI